jgi:hypothetical protein
MRIHKPIALAFAISQVAACATHPDNIDAQYVSPVTYESWTCDKLVSERDRVGAEALRITDLQRESANGDAMFMAVGMLIFWPALLGMAATKDRKSELARMRGEHQALETNIVSKGCSPAAPATTPIVP